MQGAGVQSLVQELTSPMAWPKQKQYEKWRGRQAFMIRDYCRRPTGFPLHHPIDPNIFLMSNKACHIQWITFSIFYFPSNKADFLRDCGLSKVYAFCLEPSSFSSEFSSSFKTHLGSLRRSFMTGKWKSSSSFRFLRTPLGCHKSHDCQHHRPQAAHWVYPLQDGTCYQNQSTPCSSDGPDCVV